MFWIPNQTIKQLRLMDRTKTFYELSDTNNSAYNTILQTAMDGFWLVDMQGQLLEVNESYCKMSGYSQEELRQMKISDLEVFETLEETERHIKKVKDFGQDNFETKHRRKDGTLIDVEVNVQFQNIEDGRIVVFVKDISERKESLNKIIGERDKVKFFIDNVETIILTLDNEGNITTINRKGCQILGYNEDEIVGQNWFSFCLPEPEGKEKIYPYFCQLISGDTTNIEYFENNILSKTGELKHIIWHNTLLFDNQVKITGVLSSGEDITERKKIETELVAKNKLIESIVNQSPDIMYIYDIVEQNNVFTNKGIQKILGYSVEEIMEMGNKVLPNLMHEEDWKSYSLNILPLYANANDDEPIVHEYRMKDKNGNWHWIESTEIIYQRLDDNTPKQIFGTGRDISVTKEAKKALLEADWKFRALFEKGPIGVAYHVMINDENGKAFDYRFIDANESYRELTGVDPRGKTVLEAFPGIENDPFDWIGTFDNVAKTGKTIRFEQYLEANKRWYDCVGFQYKHDHFVAAFIEITKRKEAELALKKSEELLQQKEERLSLALSATSDALWEWNYETGATHYTARWYDMLGYSDQEFEMTFETFQKLCHPDDYEATIKKIQSVLEKQKNKGYAAEFRMLHKDGTWKWILGRGNVVKRDVNQKPVILSGTNTDISERKKIEAVLKENEEKYRNLIKDMQVGVLLQGPNAEILMSNPKALELLGLSEDQLLGKTSFDPDWNVIHEDGTAFPGETHPVPQAIATRLSVNNVVMGVYHPINKERKWLLVDAVPEIDNTGRIIHVVCTFNDISDRKKTEEELVINEQYLKETQEIAQLGTYTLDITTGIWSSSEILDVIFGIPKDYDKSIGGWVSIIHPDWQQTMNDYFAQEVIGKKEQFNKQYKIIRQNDGQERWLYGIGRLKFNELGQPIMMLGTIRDITESKLAEEAIKESESRLVRAEKVAKIGNWKLNLKTKQMYSSVGARMIYGVDKDEISITDIQQIPLPEYRPLLDNALSELVTQDIPYNIEFKISRQNDGAILDIHSIAEYDKEKKTVFGVIYDITDRKKSELALKQKSDEFETQNQEYLQLNEELIQTNAELHYAKELTEESEVSLLKAQEIAKLGNWTFYVENGTLVWSRELYRIFDVDYNSFTLTNESFINLIHPEDRQNMSAWIAETIEGKNTGELEFRVTHRDGTICYIIGKGELQLNDDGIPFQINGTAQDITERKLYEVALAESRTKFIKIFDRAPVLITITSLNDGIFIDVNSYSLEFSGYKKEEIIGRKSTEIGWLIPEDREKLIKSMSDVGRFDGLELQFETKQRKKVWGLVSGEKMILDNKECLLTIITDITERKNMEFLLKVKNEESEAQNEEYLQLNEELTQMNEELFYSKEKAEESDRLKSAFLANMSHEIRTPMNGILGFTELLKEPHLTGDTRQMYISIIEKSGNRMLNIINDIISISKVESGQMDVINADTNVIEQLDFIYMFFKPEIEQKGIKLNKNYEQIPSEIIYTDREKLYAILTNLVKNAIKFTYDGSIEIGYTKKQNYLEFFVSDTGVGIPLEQKDIIFERFRQGSESLSRNYEGAGLGLAITKAYVTMLGGSIWVESQVGKGSSFIFTIPIKNKKKEDEYNSYFVSVDDDKKQIKPLKVLIAEDDEASGMLISMTIQQLSKDVIMVNNGKSAIETIKSRPDIDLILMDSKMPQIDGYEATRRIRTFNQKVVIFAQTAFAFTGEREKAIEAGCNDFITKPFSQKALIALIKKYF